MNVCVKAKIGLKKVLYKKYNICNNIDNDYIKQNILNRNFEAVVNYGMAGKCAEKAFYTPDHFYPLLYVLGAVDKEDDIEVYNDSCIMGSMSMTGYLFG